MVAVFGHQAFSGQHTRHSQRRAFGEDIGQHQLFFVWLEVQREYERRMPHGTRRHRQVIAGHPRLVETAPIAHPDPNVSVERIRNLQIAHNVVTPGIAQAQCNPVAGGIRVAGRLRRKSAWEPVRPIRRDSPPLGRRDRRLSRIAVDAHGLKRPRAGQGEAEQHRECEENCWGHVLVDQLKRWSV